MVGVVYNGGSALVEIRASSVDELNAIFGARKAAGGRLILDGGRVEIDFRLRGIVERNGTGAWYRILRLGDHRVLFAATGEPYRRTYTGGRPTIGMNPVVYHF